MAAFIMVTPIFHILANLKRHWFVKDTLGQIGAFTALREFLFLHTFRVALLGS